MFMYRKREIKTETKSQQRHSGWLTPGGVIIGLFYFGLGDSQYFPKYFVRSFYAFISNAKIHYYASKSETSTQVYVLDTKFRSKTKMIISGACSISRLDGAGLLVDHTKFHNCFCELAS